MAAGAHRREWVRVTVRVSPEAVEAAGELLREAGCSGWESVGTDAVVGYLAADGHTEERLAALRARVRALSECGLDSGPATVVGEAIAEEPWAEAWKAYFRPVRVGRVVICPTWERTELRPGDVLVRLDPGMAFGSGAHATTRLCLRALVEEDRPGGRVLDVGTGSGILAIAAALLGAARVLAVDTDPEVLPIARENSRLNGVGETVEVREGSIEDGRGEQWDVIVANIAPGPVMEAAAVARAILTPGGVYIGGGLPIARLEEVRSGLVAAGLAVERIEEEGEWAALVARA